MYNELYHFGIKGMKWGVRRYENKDGTLTEAGKKRYTNSEKRERRKEKAKKLGKILGATLGTAAVAYGGHKLYKKVRLPEDLRAIKKQKLKDVRNRFKMSPEELKEKIEILENGKRLKDLTYDQIAPGRRAAKEALASIGKKTATTVLSGAALYGLKALISRQYDKKQLADALYYGGPKKK